MSPEEKKPARPWQEIAQEASGEQDPKKLLELTAELERALDERDRVIRNKASRKSA